MVSLEWMRGAVEKHPWVSREDLTDELVIKLYQFVFQGFPFVPGTAQEWYLLGHYYNEKLGVSQPADPRVVDSYQQALALGEGRAAQALGDLYEFTDLPLALSYWKQAVALGHYHAFISLGYRGESIDSAVAYFRSAIDHQVPHAYSRLATYYEEEDLTDDVVATLLEGIAAGHHDLLDQLVNHYLQLTQLDQAIIYAQHQVELRPDYLPGYAQLAACLSEEKEKVELWKKAQTVDALLHLFKYYTGKDKPQYIFYLDKYCQVCYYDKAAQQDACRYYQKYPSPAGLRFHARLGLPLAFKKYLELMPPEAYTADFYHVLLQIDLPEEIPPVYAALKTSKWTELLLQLRLDPTYFRSLPGDIINLIKKEI